jgi:hypothetical protein
MLNERDKQSIHMYKDRSNKQLTNFLGTEYDMCLNEEKASEFSMILEVF